MGIRVKRISDPAGEDDGDRILVDRYWPRGVQRHGAVVDEWCHEVAPSPELIAWYGRKPERWDEFTRRYREELKRPAAGKALHGLLDRASSGELTLLYASRDRHYNGAAALVELLREMSTQISTAPPNARPRVRRSASPRALSPRILDWGWLALGLSVPLLLLAGGEAMVVYGRRGVLAVGVILCGLCALTVARDFVRETRFREGVAGPRHLRERCTALLEPVQELGLAMAGYALGFGALVLALFGAVLLGRLVA